MDTSGWLVLSPGLSTLGGSAQGATVDFTRQSTWRSVCSYIQSIAVVLTQVLTHLGTWVAGGLSIPTSMF